MEPITPPLMMIFEVRYCPSATDSLEGSLFHPPESDGSKRSELRSETACLLQHSGIRGVPPVSYALGTDVRKADRSSAAISQRYLWLCSTSKG